jgi:limonene-1,2-epoxide hydrolase
VEGIVKLSGLRITRRLFFRASGLGAIAAAASGEIPTLADTSSVEKTNIQVVKDFCQSWSDDPPDPDKMVDQFMTDDCLVRFGDKVAPVSGRGAVVALFGTFLTNGERYDLKIQETFARGPVVMNARIDSTLKGARSTNPTQVVGVFVLRDGRIKEWSDYV